MILASRYWTWSSGCPSLYAPFVSSGTRSKRTSSDASVALSFILPSSARSGRRSAGARGGLHYPTGRSKSNRTRVRGPRVATASARRVPAPSGWVIAPARSRREEAPMSLQDSGQYYHEVLKRIPPRGLTAFEDEAITRGVW